MWCSSFFVVIILLVFILTAFLGFVLPCGHMAFCVATVITSLVSTVPVIGTDIVYWLWGGFSVSTVTLNRFLSLHYLLPFVLVFLVLLHLIFLHEVGSGNPLGIDNKFLNNHYIDAQRFHRSEERRVGKDYVRTCKSRWSPYN